MSDSFVKQMEAAIDRFFAENSAEEIAAEIAAAENGSANFNLFMKQPPSQPIVSFQGAFHIQIKIRAVNARRMRAPKRYQRDDHFAPAQEIDVDSVGTLDEPLALAA